MVTPGTLRGQRIEQIPKESKPPAYRALCPWSQRGRQATARDERQGSAAISVPETVSSTKLWAGSQLLTSPSWDPGWLVSASSVTAWGQLPRGDTRTPGTVLSQHTLETERRGPDRWVRCMAHLEQCACQAPAHLSCSDCEGHKTSGLYLGSAWNAGLTWDSAITEHPGDWAVQTREAHATFGCGSVVHPLWALPTHASGICL